mgnify:CR=1 FL=1
MYDIIRDKSKELQTFAKQFGFKELFLITENSNDNADILLIKQAKDYRKEILAARKKFDVVITLGNFKENRKIVEAVPDVLLSPHNGSKKDFMNERASGLDHIICKIAAENKVVIGIDFSELLHAEQEREQIIGRIMQNIKLCRKYKVKLLLASFASSQLEMRDAYDLLAFAQNISMTPAEAKTSLNTISGIINRNKERKKPEYVAEGIRVVE